MFSIRKSQDRGHVDHGWLKSAHTFSFAHYYDPKHMGFRSLRVINEDRVEASQGFGAHPHRDMEIITYVLNGELEHADSMGNKAVIRPGEVQRMSAGAGLMHSERNPSEKDVHFFQIWILPESVGGKPSYGQKSFEDRFAQESKVLVISRDGREGSIPIKQDADLWIARPKSGESVSWKLRPQRGAWLQVARGEVEVNGQKIETGDAVAVEDISELKVQALSEAEVLVFDLA